MLYYRVAIVVLCVCAVFRILRTLLRQCALNSRNGPEGLAITVRPELRNAAGPPPLWGS